MSVLSFMAGKVSSQVLLAASVRIWQTLRVGSSMETARMTALASVCPVGGLVELGGLLADLLADLGGEEADEGRLFVGVIVDVVVDRDHRDVGCGGLLEHGRADLLVGDDGDDAVDARADRLIHGIHRQRRHPA